MLNFIYWPVSFILWCWHKVFGYVLGPDNAIAWALAIVFLVMTLRALLLKPAIHQVRSMRKMQEFQPQIKALQKKYANDRQRQAQEMQKLQKEHGFNPVGGCLPMLFQIPVFIGLNHVLRNFNPNFGSNYFFPKSDITSYLNSDLFGAHLDNAIWGLGVLGQQGVQPGFHWNVAPVAIPLMILASIATHFTGRISVARQQAMGQATGTQAQMMQKLQLYVFPLGVLVFGAALPVGLLLYWVSNNAWTLGQQHFVFRTMDKEEAQKKAAALEQRQALAPKPGQRPKQARTVGASPEAGVTVEPVTGNGNGNGNGSAKNGSSAKAKTAAAKPAANGKSNGAAKSNGSAKTNGSGSSGSAGSGKGSGNGVPARNGKTANGAGAGGKAKTAGAGGGGSNGGSTTSTAIPGMISNNRKKKRNRK